MSFFSKLLSFKKKFEQSFETLNNIYISRDAILNNFSIFQKLNPTYSIFPVLKSNAYGHGITQIATILKDIKLDYIAVDSYFEALKVREVNKTPILLIGYTLPQNIDKIDFSFISLTVYDFATIRELGRIGKKVKIHLKLDTGMSRQGIYIEQIKDLLKEIKKYKNIELEGVLTHLSSADEINDDFSLTQIEKFKSGIKIIENNGFKLKYKHLSNSAGSVKFKDPIFNASRLGIGLYGVNPLEKNDSNHLKLKNLKLALKFESTLIMKKSVKKGDFISYNRTFEAKKDMIIGIVPVGYYEGLSRKLSSNYSFSFNGKYLPILGRVCMNLTVIDITEVDLNVGDKIIIISDDKDSKNNIYNLAKNSETITYECFTRLAESIRRIIF